MKPSKQQYAVIGLGRFGTSVVKELNAQGAEVLVIDDNQDKINDILPFCTHAVCADAADENVLKKLGINNMDVVLICITSNVEDSIFMTLTLKEMGVKKVIVKARDPRHRQVLERVGADIVVEPEEEMGEKIAVNLVKPNMVEVMSINDDFRMIEILTPAKWSNKSLLQLELRKIEHISVILIKRGEQVIVTPGADTVLLEDDILLIAGSYADTKRVSNKSSGKVSEI